jgi:NAD(P)H-hydrate epimerase
VLAERAAAVDVMAIGPGLGQSGELVDLVRGLYRELETPLVVDADGLNALSARPESLADHAGQRIMTPHPGEFARLIGTEIGDTESERTDAAGQFATDHRVVLVLKGAGTIVTDGCELFVNSTGNNGMATGGSGDVLTGLIAALVAQKMSPLAAARLGVYVHGLAGDLAAAELTKTGMIASDLLRFLPPAWRVMESQPERCP